MDFLLDVHTHTLASGHAYNTITEMVQAAHDKNLKLYGITEHTMNMPGTCSELYFMNLRILPRTSGDMEVLFGAEANIINYKGSLDLPSPTIEQMDLVIASLHSPCITPGSKKENTNALIGAMRNPMVSIIGHPDDSRYPTDYERLVDAAKEYHCLLEVNNNSLNPKGFRSDARKNLIEMLKLCEKKGVSVIADSDAHITSDVANFCFSKPLLEELHFPEELIVNTDVARFKKFLKG